VQLAVARPTYSLSPSNISANTSNTFSFGDKNLLHLSHLFPKGGSPKNKSQKPGAFFHPEKVTLKTPRLPRIPPRFHHQNTTSKHPFFTKSPAKHHNSPPKKNPHLADKN